LLDLSADGIPQIDSLGEAHCQDVVLAPVKQVQVVVVNQVGSVQDLLRKLRDAPQALLLLLGFFFGYGCDERHVVGEGHGGSGLLLLEGEHSLVGEEGGGLPVVEVSDFHSLVFLLLSLLGRDRVRGTPFTSKQTLSDESLETL
jgi:hypothetical protein